jgi:hypothetical protein
MPASKNAKAVRAVAAFDRRPAAGGSSGAVGRSSGSEGGPDVFEEAVEGKDRRVWHVGKDPGLEAQLRFSALNTRTTPTAAGHVLTVSGDRITDSSTKESYYLARISAFRRDLVAASGLSRLKPLLRCRAAGW